jgi:hypothetical protein
MAKDRFNPAARRALGTLSGDPMDALVRATMARRDAETFNPRELRTDALAPQYDAMSEMDPYEPEPDGDADDAPYMSGAAVSANELARLRMMRGGR